MQVGGCALVAMWLAGESSRAWVQAQDAGTWVTAWGSSHQAIGDARVTNATVRLIARTAIPGDAVRIRLDNTFGVEPLAIGRVFIGTAPAAPRSFPGRTVR